MAWLRDKFRPAFTGLVWALKKDRSIRLQFCFASAAICTGFFLRLDLLEWALVLSACFLVAAAEIFNTAIEKTVDYISMQKDKRAGLIKDLSAAGVLVCSLYALCIAFLILLPAFLRLIGR